MQVNKFNELNFGFIKSKLLAIQIIHFLYFRQLTLTAIVYSDDLLVVVSWVWLNFTIQLNQ